MSGDAPEPLLKAPWAIGVVAGAVLLGVAGLLWQLTAMDEAGAGRFGTALWLAWIGRLAAGFSLVGGGLMPSRVHAGVRVALVAVGLFLILPFSDHAVLGMVERL